jgi:opacity protein-like surface antigen
LPVSQQVLINEPLSIKSNRVLVPVLVSYPLYSKNRFSLRLGAGVRYQFNSNINLSYFDFENSQLNKTKIETKSTLEPLMNVKVLYSLTNQFKIGANYHWSMIQQSLKLNTSNIQYSGFTHGIVLGLYFNPLIKSKK